MVGARGNARDASSSSTTSEGTTASEGTTTRNATKTKTKTTTRTEETSVRIILKSARGGCEDVTLEDVTWERTTVSTLKRERIAGVHEMCPTREEAMACALIYGGKVLRDEEVLREALRRGRAGAEAYAKAYVEASEGGGDGEGGETGKTREVAEYVVHVMTRRRDAEETEKAEDAREDVGSGARASSASSASMSTGAVSTGAGSTDVGRTEPSSALAARAPATPTSLLTPPTPRFNQAIDVAASPLLNATYRAAYHAAFSALSPTGSPGPGPPPLAGFTNFLNTATGATGAGGQNAGRDATGADEGRGFFPAPRRDVGVQNIRNGLPPDLNIPPGARVRVIHIRIDLKLIFKLGLMVFFLSQDASAVQLALYVVVAVFVYLQQTGALAPIAQWLTGNENIGRPRDGNANGDRGNAGANANGDGDEFNRPVVMPTRATHAAGYTGMPRSYLGEVKIFMYSLVASIFPSWIPPRLRAAQAAAPGAGRREHQD